MNDYPLAYFITFLGMLLCSLLENSTMYFLSSTSASESLSSSSASVHYSDINTECDDRDNDHIAAVLAFKSSSDTKSLAKVCAIVWECVCECGTLWDCMGLCVWIYVCLYVCLSVCLYVCMYVCLYMSAYVWLCVTVSHGPDVLLTDCVCHWLQAYVLEAAIAVHSVIIGISLGVLHQPSDAQTVRVLIVAYTVHQVLEGISLGCCILDANLGIKKIIGLTLFFALSVPCGICIGMMSKSIMDTTFAAATAGCINAVAAGTLLYIGLVEMLAEELHGPGVRKNFLLKLKMILYVFIGGFIMAILAIWA